MAIPNTTVLNLTYLGRTVLALHYRNSKGVEKWIPNSVCPQIFKHGNKIGDIHEVTIEDWWLEQNPWDRPEGEGQQSLL